MSFKQEKYYSMSELYDKIIKGKNPSLVLALEFIYESKKNDFILVDPTKYLFLNSPEYIDLNKEYQFSKLTPYSLLKEGHEGSIFIYKTNSGIFYEYLRNQGYSDNLILRVNPNYIQYVPNPSIGLFLCVLKRLKRNGDKFHNHKISFLNQPILYYEKSSKRFHYSVDEDIKLLENKLKIMSIME